MTVRTLLLVVAFLLLFLVIAIPVWLAVRVMRHPEKDRAMRRVMALQRGAEYEKGMQKFFMVNYLSTGLAWVLAVLLERFLHLDSLFSMLISGCGFCLVLVIAKWRFTGEFSKAGFVTFAIGIVAIAVILILN